MSYETPLDLDLEMLSRTERLMGHEAVERLRGASVAIFGVGGVGGYALEGLCRSGIGTLHLIDHDVVSASNLNRQILATRDVLGARKVDVARRRVESICPHTKVYSYPIFYGPDTIGAVPLDTVDYVIDAVDTVTAKLLIISRAHDCGCQVISCMGTGNKMDPSALQVADIYDTKICPLARVMRRELRRRGIEHCKVVYSTEEPSIPPDRAHPATGERWTKEIPGSNAFVPATAGLLLCATVVQDLIRQL